MSTVASFCRNCGKALTEQERAAEGVVYCASCAPAFAPPPPPPPSAAAPPPLPPRTPAANPEASPGLAFLLGLLPGVGAIYNGQYGKGLMHAFIFGLLISVAEGSHGGAEPLLAMLVASFYVYMPFEAYHTARRRQAGQPVDELSSLVSLRGGHSIAVPLTLIGLGVIFLLNNLEILRFQQVVRFWPVLLIVLGAMMLRERVAGVRDGSN
jgi:hypothetical protein